GVVVAAAGLVVLGFVLLGCVPEEYAAFVRDAGTSRLQLTLSNLVYAGLGLALCGTVLAGIRRLLQRKPTGPPRSQTPVWERVLTKLRFVPASSGSRGETEFREEGSLTEFGNQDPAGFYPRAWATAEHFLLLWLAVEVVAYFVLTPFAAVR